MLRFIREAKKGYIEVAFNGSLGSILLDTQFSVQPKASRRFLVRPGAAKLHSRAASLASSACRMDSVRLMGRFGRMRLRFDRLIFVTSHLYFAYRFSLLICLYDTPFYTTRPNRNRH